MKKGDLAFFYHSNCKEPGIVGTMEIVQEHSPDRKDHVIPFFSLSCSFYTFLYEFYLEHSMLTLSQYRPMTLKRLTTTLHQNYLSPSGVWCMLSFAASLLNR